MRLSITKSAHSTSYSVIKSAYVNKKRTSVVVEKLGNDEYIKKTYGVDDPLAWAKAHVEELNKKAKQEESTLDISFSPTSSIPVDERRKFNVGYLFLQQIFYDLGIDKICTAIKRKHRFDYDLTSILSRLIYARIIYPSSKRSTCELSSSFVESPAFELHQIYRALSVLAEEADYIQAALYKNSLKYSSRRTGVIYYDCTNYYFEIEEASGNRQYGISKENRPNPIVQMGLFMDADGIPLAFCIDPGNTNEQTTLRPLEKKLMTDFGLSRFVVCTDAGLSSTDNRKFNDTGDRAFVTTQSVKKLKKFQEEWCLDPVGWKILGGSDGKKYDLRKIDEDEHQDVIFYKERWFHENDLEQRMIVTYSLKYRNYLRSIRNGQISRADAKVRNPSSLQKSRQTDPKRFISRISYTDDGEVASRDSFYIDNDIIEQEEKYDGFYAVCTDLEDDANEILFINGRRWQIEECFRIMKHEFKARPAYLSRDDRILAHFMTCFISLIIYRFLEKRLDNRFTVDEIVSCLRGMNVTKIEGYGYIPSYDRTKLTDALHQAFGFDTSKEIITLAGMRSICKQTKNR